MTAHEERIYRLLWQRGEETNTEFRNIRISSGQLSRELRMDRNNVKGILRRLQDKRILDELEPGQADSHTPKLYKIYSFVAILKNLRESGRIHYAKSGNGVLFVYQGSSQPVPLGALPQPPQGVLEDSPHGALTRHPQGVLVYSPQGVRHPPF